MMARGFAIFPLYTSVQAHQRVFDILAHVQVGDMYPSRSLARRLDRQAKFRYYVWEQRRRLCHWVYAAQYLFDYNIIHLFLPLLDAVIISINHHHKNTAASAYGIQLCWIVILNKLISCTYAGSRHRIYIPLAFFEKSSDKRFVLFVFVEDGYFGAIHGASPWA